MRTHIFIATILSVLCLCSCADGQDMSKFKAQYPLAEWYCDTLGTYQGRKLIIIYDGAIGCAAGIFWGKELLAEGTSLWGRKDYDDPGVIYVTNGNSSMNLRLDSSSVLDNIRDLSKPCGPNDIRLVKQYEKKVGTKNPESKITYSILIDYPNGKREGDMDVIGWLANRIDENFRLNPSADIDPQMDMLADKASQRFLESEYERSIDFDELDDYTVRNSFSLDIEKEDDAPGYVTYVEHAFYYGGGAHGHPTTEFITFNRKTKKELTFEDCITSGSLPTLKRLLYRSYLSESNRSEEECSYDEFQKMLSDLNYADHLPNPGIVRGNFIFSLQPYELGSFAEGTYHLKVAINDVENLVSEEILGNQKIRLDIR